jgi:hypothetical protein
MMKEFGAPEKLERVGDRVACLPCFPQFRDVREAKNFHRSKLD